MLQAHGALVEAGRDAAAGEVERGGREGGEFAAGWKLDAGWCREGVVAGTEGIASGRGGGIVAFRSNWTRREGGSVAFRSA